MHARVSLCFFSAIFLAAKQSNSVSDLQVLVLMCIATWGFGYDFLCSGMFLRVGIELPKIEVRFEHLNVEAEAHVGGRALPRFVNFTINIIEVTIINH